MAGLQCLKRLYLECYEPERATLPGPEQVSILNFGIETGTLARALYPTGILVPEDYMHHSDAVRHTADLLLRDDVDVLFEAAFTEDDIRIRIDVLARGEAGLWDLIEVKASTSVRDEYIDDAAIQLITVERAGLAIDTVSVAHLDRIGLQTGLMQRPGQRFVVKDVTASVRRRAEGIPTKLGAMRAALRDENKPSIDTGPHCTKPYRCQFFNHCHDL